MDDRAIARWRLHTQRLAGHTYPSPGAVVTGLLAVQAENHPQASWAVATRTTGATASSFAALFDAGVILRTHVLRPTWHYVRPDDIRWLLELTAPRVRRSFRQVQQQTGVDDDSLGRARDIVTGSLMDGVHLTRQALGERLQAAGLPSDGAGLMLVMADAELAGLVCSGPMQGGQHTYALLDERAPGARRIEPDEAIAELTRRYFAGHGPATERDLAYWATLTLAEVRAGLAAVTDQLDRFDHGGRTYWFAEPAPDPGRATEPRGHLLQTLDEYHNGYQDSRDVLDVGGLIPRGRSATVGMVLVDGQMVGGMRRRVGAREVVFDVQPFRALAGDELRALQDAASRYGEFLGLGPVLRFEAPAAPASPR
jgi:hypothetical protein